MSNRICEKCIHYDVCLLHEDNFIDDVAKNGFCGKFKNKADYVEVVRCGKCKHGEKYVIDNDTFLYKCYRMGIGGFVEDFHCGYGERRDTNA